MTTTVLAQYDRKQFNVLMPDQIIRQVGPWHAARVTEVSVNPDPNAGDVFKVGSRWNKAAGASEDLFCLAKPALMRIAQAAGIAWSWHESRAEQISRDYVLYKAVGALRLPDGSWQPMIAHKELDLTVIEEELRDQWTERTDRLITEGGLQREEQGRYRHDWQPSQDGKSKRCHLDATERDRYLDGHVRTALIQWRKHKVPRAETGAMLRVIRIALGLRSQYTMPELAKPFIVPRIDFSPDYSDPTVRKALIDQGVRAMAGVFAPQPQPVAGALPAGTVRQPIETAKPDEDEDPPAGAGAGEPEESSEGVADRPVDTPAFDDPGQHDLFEGQRK